MKRTASLTWFSSRCRLPAVRIIIPESNAIVPMTMPPSVISLNCMYVFYGLLNIIQFNIYIVGLFPINAVPLCLIFGFSGHCPSDIEAQSDA